VGVSRIKGAYTGSKGRVQDPRGASRIQGPIQDPRGVSRILGVCPGSKGVYMIQDLGYTHYGSWDP